MSFLDMIQEQLQFLKYNHQVNDFSVHSTFENTACKWFLN